MSKRVFQVAQELGMANQPLIEKLKKLKLAKDDVTSLSVISEEVVAKLKVAVAEQSGSKADEKPVGAGVVRRRAPRRRPEPEAKPESPALPEATTPPEAVAQQEAEPSVDAEETPDMSETSPQVEERPRRRFATRETRDAGDSSRPAADQAPEEVAATTAVESEEVEEAPVEAAPRRRFATVTTRTDLEKVAEEAPPAVVETRTTEVSAPPAEAEVQEVQEEVQKPARRTRFATVVTRRTVEPRAEEAEALEETPVVEEETPVPEQQRARFATVVTRDDESDASKRSPVELAEIARREADAASRSRGGAEILGTIDIDVLNQRAEQRRGGGRDGGGAQDRRPDRGGGPAPGPPPGGGDFGADGRRGRRGRRVVQTGELYGKFNRGRGGNKKSQRRGGGQPVRQTTAAEHKRVVRMEEAIMVSELAHQMGVKAGEVVMKLAFDLGLRGANINTPVDFATASLIAEQYNHKVEQVGFDMSDYLPTYDNSEESLKPRPPVVTVMGHVDHGKTSLLDAIRSTGTGVAQSEAGGITQHIGAYKVQIDKGEVCFLDTPGHEAFTALRARGALATDIVVLVVAGDDGIMPQTIEAINHAREAEVPIIVAITKMDKPTANAERVRLTLTQHGLIDEAIGGDTQFVEVSALKGDGLDNLLEAVLLQAEVMELRANPDRKADGLAIESRLDVGRGPIATVLVQGGTLRVGDIVVIGKEYGRVRSMTDEFGTSLTEATPSTPVEITGLSGVPASGERFYVVEEERNARAIAEHIGVQNKQADLAVSATPGMRASGADLDSLLTDEHKELKVIVKADVQGSVEALVQSIQKLANEQVRVRVIHSGVGSITESDVNLASSSTSESDVLICGFNIRPEQRALALADQNGVRVLTHTVIYDMLDEVRQLMGGLLDPIFEEEIIGHAEVRMVFLNSRVGAVAGSMITDGVIRRGAKARVMRDGAVVFTSTIGSLRNVDRDEREMKSGMECGISVERFVDFKPGDIIECFIVHERQPELL